MRKAHGSRPGLRIRISGARLLHAAGDFLVAAYQEWQESGGERRGRTSTVVFRRSEEAPNGLAWVHVHETWVGS